MSPSVDVGFFGKLPSHGDFLRRRVSDGFVGVWDAWLQEGIAASRSALGERWLEVYLTSPAWRFACGRGVCKDVALAGVMVPSVDRVGRYFPLTIVAELPDSVDPIAAATGAGPFFDAAERLVIDTLEAAQVDFVTFEERVSELGRELEPISEGPIIVLDSAAAGILADGQDCWQVPIGSLPLFGSALGQLLSQRLSALYDPVALWWTAGSAIVEPSCLIARGLPDPNMFASLLDGSWASRRWQSIPARIERVHVNQVPVEEAAVLSFRSAGTSDIGRVRSMNEDAFIERSDVGVWAVADGLGGHADGEVASRMVCDALADLVPYSSFEDTIERARERLHQVNDHLQRVSARSIVPTRTASTVVALLARAARCAVLWAGDSRAYRWRNGELVQLTRDHHLTQPAGGAGRPGPDSNVVTRAVGAMPTLTLDQCREEVRCGDRFLLCSDGLTRIIPDAQIGGWLEHADIRVAVEGLIKATLDAGAPDNVTALIVEAFV